MHYEVWTYGNMLERTPEQLIEYVRLKGQSMIAAARYFTECNDADKAAELLMSHGLASINKVGAPSVCPNCGQWQRWGDDDCLNECRRRGFAPPVCNDADADLMPVGGSR